MVNTASSTSTVPDLPAPPPVSRGQITVGLACMSVGGTINELHVFGFHYDTSSPLLVIAAGIMIIWHAVDGAPPRVHSAE